jgi:hypothetical protein
LSGTQTIRMTGAEVSPGGLVADFLMFVPSPQQRPELRISLSDSQVTLSFLTQTGSTYTLQYKDSLNDSTWQSISPSIAGDGTLKYVNQSMGPPSRFYRLSMQ